MWRWVEPKVAPEVNSEVAPKTPQPGPAPKKPKITKSPLPANNNEEEDGKEKEVKETLKEKAVGEKVSAFKKEIESTKKVIEAEDCMLEVTRVEGKKMRNKRVELERKYMKQRKDALGKFEKEKKKTEEAEKVIKVAETHLVVRKIKTMAKLAHLEEDLKRARENAVAQQGGFRGAPFTPEGRHIKYLLEAIAKKAASLECTICLTEASTPIYGCSEYHLLCQGCRGRVASCTGCPKITSFCFLD